MIVAYFFGDGMAQKQQVNGKAALKSVAKSGVKNAKPQDALDAKPAKTVLHNAYRGKR